MEQSKGCTSRSRRLKVFLSIPAIELPVAGEAEVEPYYASSENGKQMDADFESPSLVPHESHLASNPTQSGVEILQN